MRFVCTCQTKSHPLRQVIILTGIPKNKSGKIMPGGKKPRYLGTDVGDMSTLEI